MGELTLFGSDRKFAAKLIALVTDSVPSERSKRSYAFGIEDFIRWFRDTKPDTGFSKATVNAYRSYLEAAGKAPSTVNARIVAIRKLAVEAADNGFIPVEVANAISRVKGAHQQGRRIGNWLTVQQAEDFIQEPPCYTLKGRRDRALLAVMFGCGLRRDETASLTVDHIQMREGRWVIVDLIGKGGRIRSVPMPSWAKVAIDVWLEAANISKGRIFRAVTAGDNVHGDGMSDHAVFQAVRLYAKALGLTRFAPHDIRRTYAKLSYKGRAPLEQIQISLGHASIQTTERYLGVTQDFTDAPCDHLGLRLSIQS